MRTAKKESKSSKLHTTAGLSAAVSHAKHILITIIHKYVADEEDTDDSFPVLAMHQKKNRAIRPPNANYLQHHGRDMTL